MTLLLTIICLAFIIFSIAEAILAIKLFNVNEARIKANEKQLTEIENEYKKDSKEIFHQISGLISSSGKTIRLIDKLKSGLNVIVIDESDSVYEERFSITGELILRQLFSTF